MREIPCRKIYSGAVIGIKRPPLSALRRAVCRNSSLRRPGL